MSDKDFEVDIDLSEEDLDEEDDLDFDEEDEDEEDEDFDPEEPLDPEKEGFWKRNFGSKRFEGMVPDVVKRALVGSLGSLFMSEDGLRESLTDLKLPKEAVNFMLKQADNTKKEFLRLIAKELRDFLESTNFYEEIQKILTSLSFEIRTEIRLIPNDKRFGIQPEVKNSVSVKRRRSDGEEEELVQVDDDELERDEDEDAEDEDESGAAKKGEPEGEEQPQPRPEGEKPPGFFQNLVSRAKDTVDDIVDDIMDDDEDEQEGEDKKKARRDKKKGERDKKKGERDKS